MGKRAIAHIQFDVSYLYPADELHTFEGFADAVMEAMQEAVDKEEGFWVSRGIEVIEATNVVEDHS